MQRVQTMTLTDRALATSAPIMFVGENKRSRAHIYSPDADHHLQHALVSISARTAAIADGLTAACCLLSEQQIYKAMEHIPGARVEVLKPLI